MFGTETNGFCKYCMLLSLCEMGVSVDGPFVWTGRREAKSFQEGKERFWEEGEVECGGKRTSVRVQRWQRLLSHSLPRSDRLTISRPLDYLSKSPQYPPPPPTYTDHLLIYDLKLVFILVNVLSQPDVSVSSKVWSVWTKIVLREWEELPTLTFPAASNRVPRYITSSCTGAVICEHKVKTLCPKCTLAELRGNIVGFASICEIPYYYMIFVII